MGDHGVAATEGVLGVAQRVVLGGGLGEPDITTVAAEVARLEGVSNVLLDDNGTTSSVDEPRAWKDKCVLVSSAHHGAWDNSGINSLPFFILLMSSLLKRPRVFSCRGQLMVTTSH